MEYAPIVTISLLHRKYLHPFLRLWPTTYQNGGPSYKWDFDEKSHIAT